MTPKEKAGELFDNMYQVYDMSNYNYFEIDASDNDINNQLWEKNNELYKNIYKQFAKECALIAVDKTILSRKDDSQFDDTLWAGGSDMYTMHPMYLNYWLDVKKEINNL